MEYYGKPIVSTVHDDIVSAGLRVASIAITTILIAAVDAAIQFSLKDSTAGYKTFHFMSIFAALEPYAVLIDVGEIQISSVSLQFFRDIAFLSAATLVCAHIACAVATMSTRGVIVVLSAGSLCGGLLYSGESPRMARVLSLYMCVMFGGVTLYGAIGLLCQNAKATRWARYAAMLFQSRAMVYVLCVICTTLPVVVLIGMVDAETVRNLYAAGYSPISFTGIEESPLTHRVLGVAPWVVLIAIVWYSLWSVLKSGKVCRLLDYPIMLLSALRKRNSRDLIHVVVEERYPLFLPSEVFIVRSKIRHALRHLERAGGRQIAIVPDQWKAAGNVALHFILMSRNHSAFICRRILKRVFTWEYPGLNCDVEYIENMAISGCPVVPSLPRSGWRSRGGDERSCCKEELKAQAVVQRIASASIPGVNVEASPDYFLAAMPGLVDYHQRISADQQVYRGCVEEVLGVPYLVMRDALPPHMAASLHNFDRAPTDIARFYAATHVCEAILIWLALVVVSGCTEECRSRCGDGNLRQMLNRPALGVWESIISRGSSLCCGGALEPILKARVERWDSMSVMEMAGFTMTGRHQVSTILRAWVALRNATVGHGSVTWSASQAIVQALWDSILIVINELLAVNSELRVDGNGGTQTLKGIQRKYSAGQYSGVIAGHSYSLKEYIRASPDTPGDLLLFNGYENDVAVFRSYYSGAVYKAVE